MELWATILIRTDHEELLAGAATEVLRAGFLCRTRLTVWTELTDRQIKQTARVPTIDNTLLQAGV